MQAVHDRKHEALYNNQAIYTLQGKKINSPEYLR